MGMRDHFPFSTGEWEHSSNTLIEALKLSDAVFFLLVLLLLLATQRAATETVEALLLWGTWLLLRAVGDAALVPLFLGMTA